jgi:hypothetical protein
MHVAPRALKRQSLTRQHMKTSPTCSCATPALSRTAFPLAVEARLRQGVAVADLPLTEGRRRLNPGLDSHVPRVVLFKHVSIYSYCATDCLMSRKNISGCGEALVRTF